MKSIAVFSLVLFSALDVQAITWDFEGEGNSQGWRVQEGLSSGAMSSELRLLRSEVVDGVWRIYLPSFEAGRNPAVQLISPRIGHDSALFDRVSLRFRVVHTRPFPSAIALTWTNPTNETSPGGSPLEEPGSEEPNNLSFAVWDKLTYTTDWQEFTFSGLESKPVRMGKTEWLQIWEGELIDLRIQLQLFEEDVFSPEEVPEAVEIDWLQLTGFEEQLQGELPPPAFTELTPFGGLFAAPVFCPLETRGVGTSYSFVQRNSALGDLDGDGDLDLAALSNQYAGDYWLLAYNDGTGNFRLSRSERIPSSEGGYTPIPFLDGEDLDGDGRMDLMLSRAFLTEILYNDKEEGLVVGASYDNVWPLGLGDGDGDGRADLWLADYTGEEERGRVLLFYRNEGSRFSASPMRITLDPERDNFHPIGLAHNLGEKKVDGVWWMDGTAPGQGIEVVYLDARGESVQTHLVAQVEGELVRGVGDLDLDGDVDLVAGRQVLFENTRIIKGLDLLVNQGDGTFDAVEWQGDIKLLHYVQFFDLNKDDIPDPVCVDSNIQGPGVVVGLGVKGGLPVQEGRYPLAGTGGAVLGGDVDNDGDLDLLVLERSLDESGGVYVLRNQLMERKNTAVIAEPEATPSDFRLGANYPNPFNPQTWIPFEVPEGDQPVSLKVYNVLGQPVRTLVEGRLTPGPHMVPWDGRDSQGQEVSSGTYLYRLQVGNQRATGKMVKSE